MSRFKFFLIIVFLFSLFLRLFQVDRLPHHLYMDEVAIGYNAYSILQTGKDEYGKSFPLFFRSYGDYKLPAYIYLTTSSELFFGKTELAVRLPSAAAGTLTVLFFILLLKQIGLSGRFSLLAGLLLSISPWHLQFSRAGFETNLALFFLLAGTYFFLRWNLLLSVLSFFLSLYTYHTERILTPLLILIMLAFFGRTIIHKIKKQTKLSLLKVFLILMVFSLLILPFISYSFSKEGLARASTESFTKDVIFKTGDNAANLPYRHLEQFAKNYVSYFSFDFLFFSGDQNGRHSVREIGENYLWQLPFLIYGIYIALKTPRVEGNKFFFLWLIIAPLAPSLARPSPHALRGLPMVIPIIYFVSLGIYGFLRKSKIKNQSSKSKIKAQNQSSRFAKHGKIFADRIRNFVLMKKFNNKKHATENDYQTTPFTTLFSYEQKNFVCEQSEKKKRILQIKIIIFSLLTSFFLLQYLHIYYVHYPARAAPDWSSGYKETVAFINNAENKYDKILLTQEFQNGYIYLLFYGNKSPSGKFRFVESPYTENLEKQTLYIAPSWEKRTEKNTGVINNLAGDPVFKLWEN